MEKKSSVYNEEVSKKNLENEANTEEVDSAGA